MYDDRQSLLEGVRPLFDLGAEETVAAPLHRVDLLSRLVARSDTCLSVVRLYRCPTPTERVGASLLWVLDRVCNGYEEVKVSKFLDSFTVQSHFRVSRTHHPSVPRESSVRVRRALRVVTADVNRNQKFPQRIVMTRVV